MNHPSNNIAIHDRLTSYYANNNSKRRTLENVREKKGISTHNAYVDSGYVNTGYNAYNTGSNNNNSSKPTNTAKPSIMPNIPKPYLAPKSTPNNPQRRLNKKNSQSFIQPQLH